MDQASTLKRLTVGGVRALAWACLTLCVGIVVGVGGIVAVTATRPLPQFEPVVVLRWDDVR
jgi:hypothetical protein